MLIVTRKLNETITIDPAEGLDPDLSLSEAFKEGAIEIKLLHIAGSRIRIAIEAPCQLKIWRGDRRAAGEPTPNEGDPTSSVSTSDLVPEDIET